MILKARKNPVVVEAVQWTGENWGEIERWTNNALYDEDIRKLILYVGGFEVACPLKYYIIQDEHKEIEAINPDIFNQTYEIAEEIVGRKSEKNN